MMKTCKVCGKECDKLIKGICTQHQNSMNRCKLSNNSRIFQYKGGGYTSKKKCRN